MICMAEDYGVGAGVADDDDADPAAGPAVAPIVRYASEIWDSSDALCKDAATIPLAELIRGFQKVHDTFAFVKIQTDLRFR